MSPNEFLISSAAGGILLPDASSGSEVTSGGIFITIQCTHLCAIGCWSTMVSANNWVPSGAPVHFNGIETLCPPAAGRAYLLAIAPPSMKAVDESCNAAACGEPIISKTGRAQNRAAIILAIQAS